MKFENQLVKNCCADNETGGRAEVGSLVAALNAEIADPLTSIMINVDAATRWLDGPLPDVASASSSLEEIRRAGKRICLAITELRTLHASRADK